MSAINTSAASTERAYLIQSEGKEKPNECCFNSMLYSVTSLIGATTGTIGGLIVGSFLASTQVDDDINTSDIYRDYVGYSILIGSLLGAAIAPSVLAFCRDKK